VTKARLSSVANSIRLLTSFSGEEDELGITTLANRLRLAKSSVHRLATTLASAGFLEQNTETGKYRLGVALFALARSCVAHGRGERGASEAARAAREDRRDGPAWHRRPISACSTRLYSA
jgi:DNA-binding IclR family transcriptional regulator